MSARWLGLGADVVTYPLVAADLLPVLARRSSARVFAFLQFTTFGMVVRAGMADRETVGLLGINIDRRFTIMFGLAAVVAGLAGVMYTPILPPNYHMGMDFLVLSLRRRRGRRHGLAARRGGCRLPARHPAVASPR